MCVIIDANVRDVFFGRKTGCAEVEVLWRWIDGEGGRIAVGGTDYIREIEQNRSCWRMCLEMARSGKATVCPSRVVDSRCKLVRESGLVDGTDAHIIALAIESGARVLFSGDYKSGLHAAFRNKVLIDKPRGSVYQNADHKHLLKHSSSCEAAVRRASRQWKLSDDGR